MPNSLVQAIGWGSAAFDFFLIRATPVLVARNAYFFRLLSVLPYFALGWAAFIEQMHQTGTGELLGRKLFREIT